MCLTPISHTREALAQNDQNVPGLIHRLKTKPRDQAVGKLAKRAYIAKISGPAPEWQTTQDR
jgi:hypothetical protein